MKHLIILLFLVACLTTVHGQLRVFTFTVNSKDYRVDETQLNDFFGSSFQEMLNKNTTKQSDFDLWRDSFEYWKNLAIQGRYIFSTYGNVLGGASYQGTVSKEDL